ncbi:response regulator transcription factor [Alkalibacter saccharofermentans]|uniref:Stage 0 sporulation protein A homolog n=1 Tax=Alkalibacter saccharofermentans DSM 14828 TaxID=1120975 RepID=A0A1M4UA98_9FIRM|nr:response regulator transcription factor [Alkalibacter saccharofermentans]SHE53645.1 DNA-binding response regulator, OmpR family, contains REC and winged-helix (wHTH) domain [Alkalibacter saccharofermentans DSM 14828]
MGIKILVVEDEVKIARFLQLELEHEGYEVDLAFEGRTGLEMAQESKYDVIILDIMLPLLSGMEICRRIRQEDLSVPVIMLTAKDDVSDKVMGLDIGADDYMTKPFAIEELLARIRVAVKRKAVVDKPDGNKLIMGELVLDKDQYKVTYEQELVELTKKEFELLEYLMENKNIVLTRDKIVEKVWGYDYMGETNVTDVYIRYLRSKLDQKYGVDLIKTVRGVGYKMTDE